MKTISKTERGIKYPETLTLLREKLGQKAKREPKFRFYSLYGHLMGNDVLWTAWKISRRNNGAAGVDGMTFKDIEKSPEGVPGFLNSIQQSLKEKTYRADPVKRVYVPKGRGFTVCCDKISASIFSLPDDPKEREVFYSPPLF